MKILVCISKTPDTTSKISFKENDTLFNSDGIQYIMNPYDEWFALVKALELKESHGGTVTVIHVGPAKNETIIRKALAIGADDAIRVDKVAASALDAARQIANVAQSGSFDLILAGKETIEYNASEVGAMLSELMDLPFVSFATALEVNDDTAVVTREIDGGSEVAEIQMPLVVSASKGLAEQRIPNMRGIMMAKRKPMEVVAPIDVETNVTISKFTLPEQRTSCKYIDPSDMDELVRVLHEEVKVI